MTDAPPICSACEIVAGRLVPPGGLVIRDRGLELFGVNAPTPVAGWLMITTSRHVRCLADLTDDEAARVAMLAARVQRAQRDVLGAETCYAVSLGEVVKHFHLHIVPRYASTPERLRGPKIFQASDADAIPAADQVAAVEALRRALLGR